MVTLLAIVVSIVIALGLAGELLTQPTQRDQLGVRKNDWLTLGLGILPALGTIMIVFEAWVRPPVQINPVLFAPGLILSLACIGIRTWGKYTLGYYYTFSIDLRQNHKVIEQGPYRFVRHPLYLGAFLGIVGFPMLAHSWLGFFALSLPTGFVFLLRLILEDRFLLENLGGGYRQYAQRTPRIIPFVW